MAPVFTLMKDLNTQIISIGVDIAGAGHAAWADYEMAHLLITSVTVGCTFSILNVGFVFIPILAFRIVTV